MNNLFEILYPQFKLDESKTNRLITLFSGYDSQKLAFNYLDKNVEHYKVVEFDKNALQSLNEIHNTHFVQKDIKLCGGGELNIVEKHKYNYIMTYSFPCTDLSLTGQRKGMEKGSQTRSSLLWEVERLLNETPELPDVLVMENVPEVLSAKGWIEWCNFLEKKGYNNFAEILNAKDYGIPQNRRRCFMVSILGNYSYSFPKGFDLKYKVKDFLEKNVDEKYTLSKKQIDWLKRSKFNMNSYNYNNITNKNILNTLTTSCSSRAPFFIEEPKIVNIKSSTKFMKNKDRVLENNDAMPTLITTPTYGVMVLKPRRLTPLECFKFMGVKPSDYKKITCAESQRYKQAGNSIVTTCLMAIFSQLYNDCNYVEKIDNLLSELITNETDTKITEKKES